MPCLGLLQEVEQRGSREELKHIAEVSLVEGKAVRPFAHQVWEQTVARRHVFGIGQGGRCPVMCRISNLPGSAVSQLPPSRSPKRCSPA